MSDVPTSFDTLRRRRRAIGAALAGRLTGCPLCAGRGRYPTAWNTLRACPGCDGGGLVSPTHAARMSALTCPRCDGRGGDAGDTAACEECRGFGVVVGAVEGPPNPASPRRDAA